MNGKRKRSRRIEYRDDNDSVDMDESDEDFQAAKLYQQRGQVFSMSEESDDESLCSDENEEVDDDNDDCDVSQDSGSEREFDLDSDDEDDEDDDDNEDDDNEDDDNEDDDGGDDEDYENCKYESNAEILQDKNPTGGGKKNQQTNSSKKEENVQTECPICLGEFRDQLIGNPENCKHLFCSDCIQEWSKTVNSCPVDRLKFNKIWIRSTVNGFIVEELFVDDATPAEVHTEFEDLTYCQVCRMSDREDRMLLCDTCDEGYHLECLDPPLDHVPIDNWYCFNCIPNRPASIEVPTAEHTAGQRSTRRRLRGARTARQSADFARAARAWFSGEVGSNLSRFIGYRPEASRGFYLGTSRRRRRKRKKKAENDAKRKKKRSKSSDSKVQKSRKMKRKKTKKTKKKTNRTRMKEAVKKKPEGGHKFSMVGSASLEPTLSFHLFGNKYDLDEFCEEPDEKPQDEKPQDEKPEVKQQERKPESSNPDVLSGIIEGFANLDSENVVINRDGSLVQKKKRRMMRISSDTSGDEDEPISRREKVAMNFTAGKKESEAESSIKVNSSSINSLISSTVSSAPSFTPSRMTIASTSHNLVSSAKHVDQKTPSLQEIRSWRESTTFRTTQYKPLPAVEKFKSIKIPKLNRRPMEAFKEPTEKDVNARSRLKTNDNGKIRSGGAVLRTSKDGRKDRHILGTGNVSTRRRTNFENVASAYSSGERRFSRVYETPNEECPPNETNIYVTSKKASRIPSSLTPRVPFSVSSKNILDNRNCNSSRAAEVDSNMRKESLGNLSSRAILKAADAQSRSRLDKEMEVRSRSRLENNVKTERENETARKIESNTVVKSVYEVPGKQNRQKIGIMQVINERKKALKENGSEAAVVKVEKALPKELVNVEEQFSSELESASSRSQDSMPASHCLQKSKYSHDVYQTSDGKESSGKRSQLETSPRHHAALSKQTLLRTSNASLYIQSRSQSNERPVAVVCPVHHYAEDAFSLANADIPTAKEEQALIRKRGIRRLHRLNLAEFEVKRALKSHYKNGNVDREEYKSIMKRCVDKIFASASAILAEKVERLVWKYVCKTRGIKF